MNKHIWIAAVASAAQALVLAGGCTDSGRRDDLRGAVDAAAGPTGDTDAAVASPSDGGLGARVDAADVDAGPPDFGACGQTYHSCVCDCASDQACADDCYGHAPMACSACTGRAQTLCCPAEYRAAEACYGRVTTPSSSGPARCRVDDYPCFERECAGEVMAFSTCLRSAQDPDTGTATCLAAVSACLGTAGC